MWIFLAVTHRHRVAIVSGAVLMVMGNVGPAAAEVCDKQGGVDGLIVYSEIALVILATLAFVAMSKIRTPWLFFVMGMLMTAPSLLSFFVLRESLELSNFSFSAHETCLVPTGDLAGFGLLTCLTLMFFSLGIWKARQRRSR